LALKTDSRNTTARRREYQIVGVVTEPKHVQTRGTNNYLESEEC